MCLLLSAGTLTHAADVIDLNAVECFADNQYEFQSVKVSVGPNESTYVPGDSIRLVGEILNTNEYPVVDGTLFVRVSKENPNYLVEGHEVIDEFKALENISIAEKDSVPVDVVWQVPPGLGAGNYQFSYFFSVGNKYNLGGLPFTNEIIAGYAKFNIDSKFTPSIAVPRNETVVNDQAYAHIGNWPLVASSTPIEVTQLIQNTSSTTVSTTVTYELYYWDSLSESDKLDVRQESIVINSQENYVARYVITQPTESVYYLKISVSDSVETRIVNVRIRTDIANARINYPAISTFPILKGQTTNIFSCLHTTFGAMPDISVATRLFDDTGVLIAQGAHTDNFDTNMAAVAGAYVASRDYTKVTLVTDLLRNNEIIDSYSVTYDCGVVNNEACITLRQNSIERTMILIAVALMFLVCVLLGLAYLMRMQLWWKWGLMIIGSGLLILSTLIFVTVYVEGVRVVHAETTSADGKTKTETKTFSYDVGWTSGGDSRRVANGNLDYTYTVVLNGSTQMMQGSTLYFTVDGEGSYSATGGAWDTPYCGTQQWIDDDQDSWIKFTCTTPSISSVVSSNSSVISCSGVTCTAVGPGSATLTVNLPGSTFTMTGCAETQLYGNICHNTNPRNLEFKNGSSYTGGTTKTLSTYAPAWNVSVSASGQCGTSNGQTLTSAPTTNLCSVGTASAVTTNTTTYDWSCAGIGSGVTTATCSATRADVINGQCSASRNTCILGSFNDLNDSANEYKWECLGSNGGIDSQCTAPIPEEEQGGNNSDGDPICVSNRDAIVALDSEPSVILSVLNVDSADNKFNWIFSDTTQTDIGPDYTIVTTSPVSLLDTTVEIRHDEGQGAGGPADATLTCPSVIVVTPPKAYIDKPIVEATDTCTLRWEDVDTSATCTIKNQAGQTIHSISGTPGNYTEISPTDPNNKYFVNCTYTDAGGEIGSIKSEYVSCIKKGELQEI